MVVVMRWKALRIDAISPYCLTETKNKTLSRGFRRAVSACVVHLLGLTLFALLTVPAFGADFTEPSNTFKKICSACHTFGKGTKVGPDLKGVNERRQRGWLLKFIRSSQTVIQSGDPTAKALFEQFKHQRMPDRSDLSEQQITAILDYFAANGPEQKPPDERLADTATAAEIESGRKLFYGQSPLAYGGMGCSSCHSIGGSSLSRGGSLGPDLTSAYLKYQDKAMTDFLRHPCFLRVPETGGNYLKPEESFALKAFMAQASGVKAIPAQPQKTGNNATPSVPSVTASQSNPTKRGTP
jgi:mono/diheme cytochrome c family protein